MKAFKILLILLISTTFVLGQVDLSLQKNLLTSPPYQFGSTLAYELRITNNGSIPVTNIQLQETLPCGLTFASSSATWTSSGSNLITTLTSTLNAGASTSIFIDFNLIGCTTLGAWANSAQILSFTNTSGDALTDPDASNNTDIAEADIYDVAITNKMVTPQPYGYGSNITFEIEVFNQGNKPVNNIVVRDFIAPLSGLTFDASLNTGWTVSSSTVSRTLTNTILPGQSAIVTLVLRLVRATGGVRTWSNYAEVRFAEDTQGNLIFDADSSLGSNSISENSILSGSSEDNNILSRGPFFNEDEDDHDPANAMVFDLAMTKRQQTALESFSYIQNVPYIFTVTNQGNTAATNIVVADYLSDALSYPSTPLNIARGWSYNNVTRVAKITFSEVLQPGQQDTFVLDLKPNQFYTDFDNAWTDFGEIVQADDTNPNTPNPIPDIDSTPDEIKTNDAGALADFPSDNAINGDGTGTFGSPTAATDEDDHDVHKIEIVDLALTKKIDPPASSYAPNQSVRFAIRVYNQGNVPLKNINIVDSIGSGFAYTAGGVNTGWIGSLPKLNRTIPTVLFPGKDTTIYITLTILATGNPNDYINYAEVAAAQDTFNFNRNDDADGVYDSMLFNDNLALPGSPDDDNVFGDANLDQDEDDHDVAALTVSCPKPTLTLGNPLCTSNSNTYSLMFYTSGTVVTSTLGTVSGSRIVNIPFGAAFNVTATNNSGCTTSLSFPGYTSCPNTDDCYLPQLSVGQPICNGTTYSVSFKHDFGTIAVSAGIVSGNTVINIPLGTDLIISSTDGTCYTRLNVGSPDGCGSLCINPPISISGPNCDFLETGLYSVNYTTITGTTITPSIGTLSGGMVINIPVNSPLTLTASVTGCANHVVTLPLPECPPCEKPTLTIGLLECNPSNNTYSFTYYSSVTNPNNISVSAGTKSGTRIINIPLGTPVTITARTSGTCLTTITTSGLATCPPTSCTMPKLTVGQPICNGTTYSVSFSNDIGDVTTSAGIISGNSIVNVSIGTNIIVTSTNGSCISRVGINSPIGCGNPCENPPISISGPICELESNGSYYIRYTALPGVVVDASQGIVGNGIITNIPSNNIPTIIFVELNGCSEKTIVVPAANCPVCEKPNLTVGLPVCNPSNNTYSVTYYSNVTNVIASVGTIANGVISNIPLASNVTVTATSSVQCTTSLVVPALVSCPPTSCVLPKLTVGQALCSGNTYTVSCTNDVGTLSTTAGTISGNTIINIPIGTNITVTSANGSCQSRVNVSSPTNCGIPCVNPPISVSGPICETNQNSYRINYIAAQGATVIASLGTIGNGMVTGIPSGTPITLTINSQGCQQRIITAPAATCNTTGSVSTFVWHDINGDGQQGGSEPGLPGVKVTIKNAGGMVIEIKYTDASGNASFTVPSGNYYFVYGETGEFGSTYPNLGNDNTDSDLDNSNGSASSSIFTVISGQNLNNIDAGFFLCSPVGETVWYDTNRNDVQDANENGINGIRVEIWQRWQNSWVFWDHTYTGHKPGTGSTDGYFKFCVPPGQYYIQVIMPPLGLVPAQPDRGGNDLKDSDIGNTFGAGTTASFNLLSGQMKCDIGAGFYPMASISSLIWIDENVNGIKESDEDHLSGVLVEAVDVNSGIVGQSDVSNENGQFSLDYLQQQDYFLRFTPPNGFIATLPLQGNSDDDSDVTHAYGYNTTSKITTESGQNYQGIDMGVVFAPLPVVWSSISATNNRNHHTVKWDVAIEHNTSHYIIQRALDKDAQLWTNISDKVKANNNGKPSAYSFDDIDVTKQNTYYYRVVSQDFDGKTSTSNVVSVQKDKDLSTLSIYPNPAVDKIYASFDLSNDVQVSATIYDEVGRLMVKAIISQEFKSGSHVIPIDIAHLTNGVYTLSIALGDKVSNHQIIKID